MKLTLLIVFLLKSSWLHGNPITGADHDLHCVTDYLLTINCTLNIAPSGNTSDSNGSYWLTCRETFEEEEYSCMLTSTKEGYFCSLKTSDYDYDTSETFFDVDIYEISLCHIRSNGSKICSVLDEAFSPARNIKPNAPCCLTLSHNSSQQHFTWMSTYEAYSHFTPLFENLQYQLQIYKNGDKHEDIPHGINTNSEHYSVDEEQFPPDTDYVARVRSRPNMGFYRGQWSDWSVEVHWRTAPAVEDSSANAFVAEVGKKVFIPLCVMVLLVLLLCYAPVKKWRQGAFIPTPAPYFDTLYKDCQGDFKSWVVTQDSTAAMTKTEEVLHINTLTKCADVQQKKEEEDEEERHVHLQLMEGSGYSNMTIPACDQVLLGFPYAVSTMALHSDQKDDLESLTLCSEPRSPAGDSGCWLSSDSSLEKEPPWYCNEYCTLSAFQQSGSVTAERCGSL
ncbi:interleukin-21 receptor [Stegastes partitus]|uniref:Interleukin-21 receptor-like n=1 Tax=Stegastes partitus TaxID=144197 RepID=A0A3B5AK24_9TELE|nr:PREDICTED: interleukin-21 receptor-like [Stegastes partitus]